MHGSLAHESLHFKLDLGGFSHLQGSPVRLTRTHSQYTCNNTVVKRSKAVWQFVLEALHRYRAGACTSYGITQSYLPPGRGSVSRPYRI